MVDLTREVVEGWAQEAREELPSSLGTAFDESEVLLFVANKAAANAESKKLLEHSEFAIRGLLEFIQGLPDDVVEKSPAVPGIDGDWLDTLQANLKTAIAAS